MRWKRVVWLGCLAPAFAGCHTAYHPAHDILAEKATAHDEKQIEREISHRAHAAWREVRCEYPRRMFTAEFRDGFLDGYTDYLDRGGDAQPPAVPPLRYTRNAKYFSPEGHALIREYFLGFKYGVDVALATGQRQYFTVPVLIPEVGESLAPAIPTLQIRPLPPANSSDSPAAPTIPAPAPSIPLFKPRPVPATEPPVSKIPGFHEPTWGGFTTERKGTPPARLMSREKPAAPVSPSPVVASDEAMSKFDRPYKVLTDVTPLPSLPPIPSIPEPPPEVPSLPPSDPPPPLADDYPVFPPNHVLPPEKPPTPPDETP